MKSLISCITILLFTVGCISVQAKSFLWEVKNSKAVIYLYGSIHMAKASMYPLNSSIEQAFEIADTLVVEVNELKSNQVKIQKILLTKGVYSGDETLYDNLDKKTRSLLQAFLKKYSLAYFSIAKMRPTMAALTLTITRMTQLGFSAERGIDRYFINKAQANNKAILQLESGVEQLNLLLNITDDDLFLRYSLTSLSEAESVMATLIDAWKTGNVTKMHKLVLEEPLNDNPLFKPLFKALFTDRNIKMVKKIKQYLNTKNNYFVVIGAGHMVGEQGIIALLKKSGYTVKQL
ncbi:MAG: TraB/GumN family protein [Gammaproteobacteria bacterium]|nr:TraB/GumN family protein [Gammaproteobacteria bacterium]